MATALNNRPDQDEDERTDDSELSRLNDMFAAPSATESGSSKLKEEQDKVSALNRYNNLLCFTK